MRNEAKDGCVFLECPSLYKLFLVVARYTIVRIAGEGGGGAVIAGKEESMSRFLSTALIKAAHMQYAIGYHTVRTVRTVRY